MNIEDFCIGMRVVLIEDDPESAGISGDYNEFLQNGMTGTVRTIDNRNTKTPIGVEWDIPDGCDESDMEDHLHSLGGELDWDYGWNCGVDQLAPVAEEEIEESQLDLGFLFGGD